MFNKSIFSSAALCVVFLLIASPGFATEPSEPITAKELVAKMGLGTNLGNTFETTQATNLTAWNPTKMFIDRSIDAGFMHIRIPVNWMRAGPKADENGNIDFSHPDVVTVKRLVDYVLNDVNAQRRNAGLQEIVLIINTHHETWFGNEEDDLIGRANFDENMEILKNIWSGICELFADAPQETLIFELFNEPENYLRTGPWAIATVVEMNKQLHQHIREFELDGERIHQHRNLMIGGTNWNSPSFLRETYDRRIDLPGAGDDPFLMGTFHWYYNPGTQHTGKQDVQNRVLPVLEDFTYRHDVPVVMGEFGYDHRNDIDEEVLDYYSELAHGTMELGFASTVWDDNGWFRILNRSTMSFNAIKDVLIDLLENDYPGPEPEVNPETVVEIEGSVQPLTVNPREIDRRMMLPMVELFDSLGITVELDSASGLATANVNGRLLQIEAGKRVAEIGERRVLLDAYPVYEDSDILVPLVWITEALGRPAEWYRVTNTVRIRPIQSNTAPALSLNNEHSVEPGETVEFEVVATDLDEPAQPLTLSLVGAPTGARLTSTGQFSWTPTDEQAGQNHTFEIQVADRLQSAAQSVSITVNDLPSEQRASQFFGRAVRDSWIISQRMGGFSATSFPWVFSDQLQNLRFVESASAKAWLYIHGTDIQEGAWFWDSALDEWWYTKESIYPWVYRPSIQNWTLIDDIQLP